MKKSGCDTKRVISVICGIVAAVDVFLLGAYLYRSINSNTQ